jgi:hypothetical protein
LSVNFASLRRPADSVRNNRGDQTGAKSIAADRIGKRWAERADRNAQPGQVFVARPASTPRPTTKMLGWVRNPLDAIADRSRINEVPAMRNTQGQEILFVIDSEFAVARL